MVIPLAYFAEAGKMSMFSFSRGAKRALVAGGALVIATVSVATFAGSAATAAPKSPQRPAAASTPSAGKVPRPVAVTVDPRTTAYLLLDLTSAVCAPHPTCISSLPAAAGLLAKARAAGATVVYSQTAAAGSAILPQVAPQPGDPVVTARADKFFGTDLDQILSSRGIKTLVIVGTAANGAVLYTTFEANLRGYTVVVAEDGVSAVSPFIMKYSLFQLLNQPGFTNTANTPLTANAVTLSKSKLVTFATSS
jgi:nicotinamidase-related amidase